MLESQGMDWTDVDRILLNERAYEDFHRRAEMSHANYATQDAPAVRLTSGDEKILFVNKAGYEEEILL
jgi:hypothetical protein